jgi:hypothetical protein
MKKCNDNSYNCSSGKRQKQQRKDKYSHFEYLGKRLQRYAQEKITKLPFGLLYVRRTSWRWVIFPNENPNIWQKRLCYFLLFTGISNGAKKPSNKFGDTIFRCNMNEVWCL